MRELSAGRTTSLNSSSVIPVRHHHRRNLADKIPGASAATVSRRGPARRADEIMIRSSRLDGANAVMETLTPKAVRTVCRIWACRLSKSDKHGHMLRRGRGQALACGCGSTELPVRSRSESTPCGSKPPPYARWAGVAWGCVMEESEKGTRRQGAYRAYSKT